MYVYVYIYIYIYIHILYTHIVGGWRGAASKLVIARSARTVRLCLFFYCLCLLFVEYCPPSAGRVAGWLGASERYRCSLLFSPLLVYVVALIYVSCIWVGHRSPAKRI